MNMLTKYNLLYVGEKIKMLQRAVPRVLVCEKRNACMVMPEDVFFNVKRDYPVVD